MGEGPHHGSLNLLMRGGDRKDHSPWRRGSGRPAHTLQMQRRKRQGLLGWIKNRAIGDNWPFQNLVKKTLASGMFVVLPRNVIIRSQFMTEKLTE